MKNFLFIVVITLFSISCDINDLPDDTQANPSITGTGSFEFSYEEIIDNKSIDVFYHVPSNLSSQTPILFVLHGGSRNARDYRNSLINSSNDLGFIIIAPRFSSQDFSGGDGYNLSNIFIDGDNPSQATLNSENDWVISIFDPLFEYVKEITDNKSLKYDLYGNSAGGQLAHRFLLFKTNSNVNRVVASAPGWYTVPDVNIDFPYGLNKGPFQYSNILLEDVFYKKLYIIVGEYDIATPNQDSSLRDTPEAMLQGETRLSRALHFYNRSLEISDQINSLFNWEFHIVPSAGHNNSLTAPFAANLLYNY